MATNNMYKAWVSQAYMHNEQNIHHMQVSDKNYNILNLRVASGSTHDGFVWRFSDQREVMVNLRNEHEPHYFLLADTGYTQSPYLLTPINNADVGSPEYFFSRAVQGDRCVIEQTYGIWNEVCRCINGDRVLHYAPQFAAEIVLAARVFYNFLRHHGMPMPIPPYVDPYLGGHREFFDDDNYEVGLQERQNIVNEYFNNRA